MKVKEAIKNGNKEMKTDTRFKSVDIDKDTLCPGCGFNMIKGSCAHKKLDEGKIYCMDCYKEIRIED